MKPRRQGLDVRPVRTRRDRAAWLELPHRIHAGCPSWIAPLEIQEKRRVLRKWNPFFGFGEAELFIAWDGHTPVGRISAQVNRRHLQHHHDATGHFGFFECANDQDAASALVEAAAAHLRAKCLQRMVGPLSFSINEEVGLLVDGFDTPPAFLMGHAAPWAGGLLEQAGLSKEVDLFAYRVRPSEVPPVITRLAGLAARSDRISVRPFDMRNYRADVETLIEIFNDAWSDNWGFVPFAKAEIDALISETRFLLRGKYGRLLTIDGKPAGVMLALPDVNEVMQGTEGRLLPMAWMRLLRTSWRDSWRTARIPLLGLRKSLRRDPAAPAMLALLVSEFLSEAQSYALDWVELSWVLESNLPMNKLAQMAAGPPVKTYRVYGQSL